MDKNEVEKVGKFQEHKNLIDPSRLAVVAFLQDDATKHILTAIYAVVDHNPEHERNEGGISVVGVDEDFAGNLDAPRCSLHALEANAQVVLNLPADHAGIVLLQEKQLREEMEFRKAPFRKIQPFSLMHYLNSSGCTRHLSARRAAFTTLRVNSLAISRKIILTRRR